MTVLLLTASLSAVAGTPLQTIVLQEEFVNSGAQLRVFNASPDIGPIDVYVAQYLEAENTAYGEVSDAADMSTGSYTTRIYRTGETEDPLVETGVTYEQGRIHTLVLTGTEDDLELLNVVSSSPGMNPGSAYVRFVHVSSDAEAKDLAIAGGELLHSNVAYREQSDFAELPFGTYDMAVRALGSCLTDIEVPGVWMKQTYFYTVYLFGLASDEDPVEQEYMTFVPAAARNQGLMGSSYTTDVDLLNTGDEDVTYTLIWLPRDTDNSEPLMSEPMTLASGTTVRHSDVLGTVFGFGDDQSVAGALAVTCSQDVLKVFSRTANLTDDGTYGQGMAGFPAADLIPAGTIKHIQFFTENDGFRSNLGILNGTDRPITVQWRQKLPDGTVYRNSFVDLPPWGNIQRNKIYDTVQPIEGGYIEIWSETYGARFMAYGSVLDNPTSDPTTVYPQ